ncbi:MAG: CoA ester lyase [Micrococcales bacterium]|nr:MAG: CoA ester lyase [Micrococcales bacterium]
MPAANERALAKAETLDYDAVILDLEDAVAPEDKPAARERAVAAASRLRERGRGIVTIRVNGPHTGWHQNDLAAVADSAAHAVVLPKVGEPEDVWAAQDGLDRLSAPEQLRIWAMIETPGAVVNSPRIAASAAGLQALILGANDLVHELGAQHVPGRAPLLAGLGWCVLAARAAGVRIIDAVFNDVEDLDGLRAECVQSRQFGFDGKTLIHPKQLAICREAFSPDDSEVAAARQIIQAWQDAGEGGVTTVNGRMIELMHVENARRLLAAADAGD